MKRDAAPNSVGRVTTSVFMDTDGNRLPDTILYLFNSKSLTFSMLLDEYIQRGSEIIFDQDNASKSNGLSELGPVHPRI
jgi:hypothetical protein